MRAQRRKLPAGAASRTAAGRTVGRRTGGRSADARHRRGLALCGAGRLEAALAPLSDAVRLDPGDPRFARDLGAVYAALRRWTDALAVLTPRIREMDAGIQAVFLMAGREARQVEAALAAIEPLAPGGHADLLCEYGQALQVVGREREAEAALLACLATPSPPPRVHDALSVLYIEGGSGDLGHVHSVEYARRNPTSAPAQLRLATSLALRGRLAESRAARLNAIALGLRSPDDWTTALHLMLNDGEETGVTIRQACAAAFEPDGPARRPRRRPRAGRLRIGYVSCEFDVAPASHFLNPFLLAHDRSRVETFLYDTRTKKASADLDRARLGEHLRDVGRLDDDAVLRQMAADGIEVLVELSALFPESRIPILARRGAPIQATLPQCPTTTGCRAVDYLFTDRWTSPPGTEREYAERLHYLDSGHVIYTPPAACPPARPVPALAGEGVTFGLLQRFMKIGPDVWDAVADVLRAVRGSRLLLHNGDAELARADSATRTFCREQLASRHVDSARLSFAGPMSLAAHLDLVSGLDVALDTWPYSGTTTTCECLWMGVPVVTLAGRTHASRVSAALLRRCGLEALVAGDRAGYVGIAADLARDVEQLRGLRTTLRDRAVASGLTDGRALAAGMEAAYESWVRR